MLTRVVTAAILLVVCLVLAACGGGDSGSDTSGGASTADAGETSADDGGGDTTAEEGEGDSSADEGDDAETGVAPSVSGPSLKKAEYIKKGDAVCEKVPQTYQSLAAEVAAAQKKQKNVPKKKQEEEVNLKAAVPPLRTAVEEFAVLGTPEGNEELAQEIVDALQSAADSLEEDPSQPLAGPGSPFGEFVKLTQKYGLKACPQL